MISTTIRLILSGSRAMLVQTSPQAEVAPGMLKGPK